MTFLFFATSNFKPDVGGVAELGHQLVSSLCRAGHDITVIARSAEANHSDEEAPYRIERSSSRQPKKIADRLIKEKRPDALFVLIIGSALGTALGLGRKYKRIS